MTYTISQINSDAAITLIAGRVPDNMAVVSYIDGGNLGGRQILVQIDGAGQYAALCGGVLQSLDQGAVRAALDAVADALWFLPHSVSRNTARTMEQDRMDRAAARASERAADEAINQFRAASGFDWSALHIA